MSTRNRRPLGTMKRHSSSSENGGVVKPTTAQPPHLSKKRPPLSNLTNHTRPSMVPCTANKSSINLKKDSNVTTFPKIPKPNPALQSNNNSRDVSVTRIALPPPPSPTRMDISPTPSQPPSLSFDDNDSMSTSESLNSPQVEYLDHNDLASIQRKASQNLHISTPTPDSGSSCKREILAIDKVVDVDDNFMDPQYCSTIACDIYKHLRASETQKRPSVDFMEKVQKDINPSMRAILIDWLVEVAEEYRLVPDTLYLTVNYIDRYLSGNAMNRQRLQLLGVACMMVASKYEEICAPQVEEFCYITDNTYFKEEVLQMESTVLNFLKFEMTAPTIKCFLRRFVRAAQVMNEIPSMQLECLANYLAELSLLEYNMLQYSPSLTAASAVFLAKYILCPSHRPWNSTLQHYTLYQPSDLRECVQALHQLCLNCHSSSLPAIREKYSQHKYKFVAKKYCPSSIPLEYFHSASI